MRILLIEDDQKLAGYLKKGFTEEQYAVDVFHEGREGAYWAHEVEYDVVILDLMLPGKDGLIICRELREAGKSMPILMLTARDGVEDRVKGLDSGADDYLTKPFFFDELLARVRALLRRIQNSQQHHTLVVSDLELDVVRHSVTRAGKAITLSGKEYALLEYLMRNAGRVVTESNIIEHVWDMQSEPFTNVVSVYIHYLRNKIDKGYDKKLIQTIRSIGYVIKDV
jgi:heavy metal response regulator